jgi:VanZ family protein
VAGCGLLWWASSAPRTVPLPLAHGDKLLHAAAYAVLALGWYAALRVTWPWHDYRRHAWVALALAAGYGALDEWHQSFVPGRAASLPDWVADVAGATVTATLAATIKRPRTEPA